MPKILENVASDVFDFLKSRFQIDSTLDKDGKPTSEPSEMEVFGFNFITSNNKNLGKIVINLSDDSESRNSIKVVISQDISNSISQNQKDIRGFLIDLRRFAKSHMLGFDIRNIDRSNVNKMIESKFGDLSGSVKTSIQPLDNIKIIIKHTANVDTTQRAARSRRIGKIYLSNNAGERFLLPFVSLNAARAMAQHLCAGGSIYDSIGSSICQLVQEKKSLAKFLRKTKHLTLTNSDALSIFNVIKSRYEDVNKLLSTLSRGHIDQELSPYELDDDKSDNIGNIFGNDITDTLSEQMPYVKRAYNMKKINELEQFNEWVNTAGSHNEDNTSKDEECYICGGTGKTEYMDCKHCDGSGIEPEHVEKISESKKVIIKELDNLKKNAGLLMEVDPPSDSGQLSPVSGPEIDAEDLRFRKHIPTDTTGSESPLSLLVDNDDDINDEVDMDFDDIEEPETEMSESGQYEVVYNNSKNRKFRKIISAETPGSAELEAYNYADGHGYEIVSISPATGIMSDLDADEEYAENEDEFMESINSIRRLSGIKQLKESWADEIYQVWSGLAPDLYSSVPDLDGDSAREVVNQKLYDENPEWAKLPHERRHLLLLANLSNNEVDGNKISQDTDMYSDHNEIDGIDNVDVDDSWETYNSNQLAAKNDETQYCTGCGQILDSSAVTCDCGLGAPLKPFIK